MAAEVGGNGRPHNDGAGPHLGFVGVTATASKPALDPPAQHHPHCHPRVLFTGWREWLLLAHGPCSPMDTAKHHLKSL